MNNIDYSLYFITDRDTLHEDYDFFQSVEDAILGGATLVQLREKTLDTKDFYEVALKVKEICHKYNVPLIINDRLDIALAIDADGIHVGQDDMPMTVIRDIIGDNKIIGVSATTYEQALKAYNDGADYLGVGAMYSTNTKTDANMTSLDELKKIRDNISIPIVVIGGINENTIPDFKNLNIDGLAIVSAITSKKDIVKASEYIKSLYYDNFPIEGAIFDLDGTLLDSIPIWDSILVKYLNNYNVEPDEYYQKEIWTLDIYDAIKLAKEYFNIDEDINLMMKKWDDMMKKEYNENVGLFKGSINILNYFKNKNIPMAIATALPKDYFLDCLVNNGIKNYFNTIYSTYEFENGKERGDIFIQISKDLNINPKATIVFEDSTHSLYGIKEAQMQSCLIDGSKYTINKDTNRLIDLKINNLEEDKLYEYLNRKF